MAERLALLVVVLAAAASWLWIHDFAQRRFFTVDEYQYGHATWLVSEGEVPYRDFYEHHFPGSYVLHAPLLPTQGAFSERALWLREVSFGYAFAASLALAIATFATTRSRLSSVLAGFVPATFGFGLMSAVDYRADNFGAFAWLIGLAGLEINRRWRRRGLAAASGLAFAVAVLMTQKMLFLVGGSLAIAIVVDAVGRRRATGVGEPLVREAGVVVGVTAGALLVALAVAAASGVVGQAWQNTIAFGFEHEALYHEVAFTEFAAPFWRETFTSTGPLLFLGVVGAFSKSARFWSIPLAVCVLGGLLIRAQFPYNYVALCTLLVLCAVRGYGGWVDRVVVERPAWVGAGLALVPLAVLPDQLGFVSGASSNAHQLRVLDRIQAHTRPEDAVIDSAGGALFRPHASDYWYHGRAHRKLWASELDRDLVRDYRASQALFWIRDFRSDELSRRVQRYRARHYVSAGGDLLALGFYVPEVKSGPAQEIVIDVVRPGEYFVHPVLAGSDPPSVADEPIDPEGLSIDGDSLTGPSVALSVGRHRLRVAPGSRRTILSPLPADVFRDLDRPGVAHTPLFEYDRAAHGRRS